jgi:hypothetical protein
MLTVCDQGFAWKFAGVVQMRSSSRNLALLSNSLMRRAPISLGVDSKITPAQFDSLMPPLTQLSGELQEEQWLIILRSPTVHRLQRLSFMNTNEMTQPSTMNLIASLPQLQSLFVVCNVRNGSDSFSPLVQAASLTEFSIKGEWFEARHPCVSGNTGLPNLRKLSFERLCFPKGTFRQTLTSSALSSLVELTFTSFLCQSPDILYRRDPTSEDWEVSFRNLQSLQRLSLWDVYGVDAVLQHVPILKSLQLLTLSCASSMHPFWHRSPTPSILVDVLNANLRLQVELCIQGTFFLWNYFARNPESAAPFLGTPINWEDIRSMPALPRVRFNDVPPGQQWIEEA